MRIPYIITLYVLLSAQVVSAQSLTLIDSFKTHLEQTVNDSHRVQLLNDLAWELMYSNADTAITLSSRALAIAEENNWKGRIASSAGGLGTFYWVTGNYPLALEYFFTSLKAYEKLKHKGGIAAILVNIGNIYIAEHDYPTSFEYYFRALKLNRELDNKSSIAIILNNLGSGYHDQGDYPKALEYLLEGLELDEELNDTLGQARTLDNIGILYLDQSMFSNALLYFQRALKLSEVGNNKIGLASTLSNLGRLYTKTGEFKAAESTLKRSLKLSQEIGSKEYLRNIYDNLSALYDTTGRPSLAFEAYKLYIIYHDSLNNEENIRAQTRTEMTYEYEKAELVAEQQVREAARLLAAQTGRRNNLQYSIILLGLLVLGSLILSLGKLSLPTRLAEGIIFFAFLILFEFLLVLADPYIETWSGGAPGSKLLFNAGIAALIFPAHAFFESKLKRRLEKP